MARLDIGIGFTADERQRVGALYWEAFARKLRAAFSDAQVGLLQVSAALDSERLLIARHHGMIVGLCGFRLGGRGALHLSWDELRHTLGVLRTARALVAASVLSKSDKAGRLTLDGICVDEKMRGLGIGTALLLATEGLARDHGLDEVELSVIDSNPRAAALYRRHGFAPVGGGSLGILSPVYGFDEYTVMTKEVRR